MICTIEIASCGMTYLPSFMKTATGVQVILRFCLRKLRGCNVGITDGKDFYLSRWDGLRCRDICTKFHKDWFRHSQVNRGGYTDTQRAKWSYKPTFIFDVIWTTNNMSTVSWKSWGHYKKHQHVPNWNLYQAPLEYMSTALIFLLNLRWQEHTFVRSNAVHSMNTFLVLSVILEWFPLIIGGIERTTPFLS
jgi:hypothetical protein